ncbi:MAG TPA: hypothetical protein VND93_08925 [Myxococcales bacterium]|jgi:hypothetical protein|nr:hypothetical protein [Myxococcales bacterium]
MHLPNALHACRAAGAALLVISGGAALAGSSDTSDIACGSTAAGWSAPNGTLVLSRGGEGPVTAVLDSVGEYRTHSMLSHGPGGQVTHETMHSPGTTGWPTYCSTPLRPNELRDGYPGASRADQGAMYRFLYGSGSLEFIAYQNSRTSAGFNTNGSSIANWVLSYIPTVTVASLQDSGHTLKRLYGPNGYILNYVLYQYRDLGDVNYGGVGWNNGMVCSTLISHAHYRAGYGAVYAYTYNHTQLVTAGGALYNSVENECNTGLGFWKGIGTTITCFESICDDAARQVRNCMVAGRCDTDSSTVWSNVSNDSTTVARSISPDRLGGWSGHPYTGAGVSVWAYDTNNTLQWNSGGSVYGCWF